MNYKGVIIEESLENLTVLRKLALISQKIESITDAHQTPWLTQWTLDTIEIPEKKADEIAEIISHSFDKAHPDWYADFKNENYHFVIYPQKIFKVDLHNPLLYKKAREYGISLGIPEYQVDFAPNDKVWER